MNLAASINAILDPVAASIWSDGVLYRESDPVANAPAGDDSDFDPSGILDTATAKPAATAHPCKVQPDDGSRGQRAGSSVETKGETIFVLASSLPFIPRANDRIEATFPGQPTQEFSIASITGQDPAGIYYICDVIR